jgi:hypothetical protein
LPDVLHVTQTEDRLSFEDSTGAVVRDVTIAASAATAATDSAAAPGPPRPTGRWREGRLVIERPAWRGNRVTETLALEDPETLVMETKVETDGTMPGREFKRVYRRVTEW